MSKKKKYNKKPNKEENLQQEELQFEDDSLGGNWVPHLDELAIRLSVKETKEPYQGLVLLSKSGRAYSLTDIILNFTEFTAQALQIMMELVKRGEEDYEHTKRNGQPEKTDTPTGDSESDKR